MVEVWGEGAGVVPLAAGMTPQTASRVHPRHCRLRASERNQADQDAHPHPTASQDHPGGGAHLQ
jgi:hypothetical protein